MDISADKYKLVINQPGHILAVLHTMLGIVRGLLGFFTLTEEERLKAGIYLGGEGRDE